MLCHLWVQVVLYHQHDGSCLSAAVRIVVDWSSLHLVVGAVAIHIDATVATELFGKLGSQCGMKMLWEIAQRIAQCKLLLLRSEYVLALWRMIYAAVVRFRLGQIVGYALLYGFLEVFGSHGQDC